MTYQQLKELLVRLGFSLEQVQPRWLRYLHPSSETEIILVEKKPQDRVRPTDLWSVREHLIQKGLVREDAFDSLLNQDPASSKSSTG